MIYYKELAHVFKDYEKSQDLVGKQETQRSQTQDWQADYSRTDRF